MKLSTIRYISVLVCLLILTGCSRHASTSDTSEAEKLDQKLQELRDLRKYHTTARMIDSIQQTAKMPDAWISGERGCLSYNDQQFLQAEKDLELALDDETLERDYRSSYLNFVIYMVATKLDLHKWEEALRLAQRFCKNTRQSESYYEQGVSLRLYAYIGSCQLRLRNWAEARTIGENAYYSCLDLEKKDPSSSYVTFYVVLTMLEAFNDLSIWEDTNKWVDRAFEVLDRVPLYTSHPNEYDHWTGFFYAIRSVALQRLGHSQEAAEAFKMFESTRFSKGLGGLNGIYYLAATAQWKKIENMLPTVDSLIANTGALLVPEYLEDRYGYQYLVYRNLGQTDKVLAVTDSVFKYFRASIDNERISKALDLAKQYETQEKETALAEKDRQLAIIWTGAMAGIMLLFIIGLAGFIIIRRRSEQQLKEEHEKLMKAYDQLVVANALAEESAKMKNSFIRQISHEIRTPLNILSGFTQVLTNPSLDLDDATKEEANKSIVNNTHRITKLVNKMLELSDISSKAVIDRTDEVTIGSIALQAVADSGIQDQEEASVTFSLETDEAMSSRIILTNQRSAVRSLVLLLDNALKFLGAPNEPQKGHVTLRITDDPTSSMVRYMVEDTGIGVPADEAEHIFEEFVQLDDYYDGTGIGLSVARSLVRRIGGDIILDTTYTGGARFVMSLPYTIESPN